MLITFKSDAGAGVIMLGDAAKKLIGILGKDAGDPKGIVTVEQLPDAITRLRAAIEQDRARQAESPSDDDEREQDGDNKGMAAPVGLAQRAWPLLELLEASRREGVPVVWGV